MEIDGQLVESDPFEFELSVGEHSIRPYNEPSGRVTFDDAAESYCVHLGVEHLVTGEVVYGPPLCLEHGDLAAPMIRETTADEFQFSFRCEGAPLFYVDEAPEAENGCRIGGGSPDGAALGLFILGLCARRRRG